MAQIKEKYLNHRTLEDDYYDEEAVALSLEELERQRMFLEKVLDNMDNGTHTDSNNLKETQ